MPTRKELLENIERTKQEINHLQALIESCSDVDPAALRGLSATRHNY